ncbi:MAG: ABC transporter permease [Acidobacteriia bacterium]|nr:ABC transporter permease [Terriglobia bacterium]
MRFLQELSLLFRAVFRRPDVEREMEAELAGHLECEVRQLIASGVPPAEARRRAAAGMGRIDSIKEECRDARGTAAWEQLRQDASFGARLLFKNRASPAVALATMALGIGSTTAVFSIVDTVLIRPLPFPRPDRLYWVRDIGVRGAFDTLQANSRLAEYAADTGVRAFNTAGRDWPERVKGSEVSANFFQTLGVRPLLGRGFAGGENRPGAARVAVLSYDYWTRRYGARRDAIGQRLPLDEVGYEIVGVMPAGFRYPAPEASFWVPMSLDPRDIGEYWGSGIAGFFARLHDGVTPEAAEAELRAWVTNIRPMFPWRMPDAWGVGAGLTELRESLVAGARTRGLLLFGVAGLVLLIAIVNVANLMIGQTAARQRELALRASLGATPGRLARQLLTEAVALAAAGGILGTALAFAQLAALKRLLPAATPRLAEVAIDGRVLAFAAAVSLGSGLLFGLLPAWRARTRQSLAALEGSRATSGGRAVRTDAALVVTEAAFATILLVGAGLLLRTFWSMLHVDPGFRPEAVVTAELSPGRSAAASAAKSAALYQQVRDRLAGYPGVTHAAAASSLPLTPEITAVATAIEDHPIPPQDPQLVLWTTEVTPDYLDALGVPLLRGRRFTAADRRGAPEVALISRATALHFWPGGDPVGKRLKPFSNDEWRTIVGVVDDVRSYSIAGPPGWISGEIYVPLAQPIWVPQTVSLAVRFRGDPGAFEKRLPGMIQEVCAACAVNRIAPLDAVVARAVETPRSTAWLVGGFALLALGLAAAGTYGVVNHGVVRRTRELGVRLALGAGRARLTALVLGATLRYTLVGAAIGLAVSWGLARSIRTLLFGVAAHDVVSFVVPPLVLIAMGVLASLLPVRRALRIDPAQALREG